MTTQQQQAKEHYFGTGMTQKEIAQAVGVSDRTIHRWIKQEAWDRLKKAAQALPIVMADNMCNQLLELQYSIASRDEGNRFPTMQEAEITRKLVNSLTKLKDYPSLSLNIQMLMGFSNFIGTADHEFNKKFLAYADTYLKGKARNCYYSYNFEYDIPPLRPSPEEEAELKQHKENTEACETTSAKECATKTKKESPVDSVTLSDVILSEAEGRSATQLVSSIEAKSTPPQSTNKKTEPQPDIHTDQTGESQILKATQPTSEPGNPCPLPDKTGHKPDIGNTSIPIPPGNVIWFGGNEVYDAQINLKREIKSGEANWLYRNGYINR